MQQLGYLIGYFGFALQILLLIRFLKIKVWRHYPFFFAYFAYTIINGVSGPTVLHFEPQIYAVWYWTDYMIGTVLRFAVAWEIFRQLFPSDFPARRLAGCVLSIVYCVLAGFFWTWSLPGDAVSDVVLKMALAIVAWIFTVLGIGKYYSRTLGHNIRGMAFGFLGYMCTQIMLYSANGLFSSLYPILSLLAPLAFTYMILMWIYALWVYVPNEPPLISDKTAVHDALAQWEKQMFTITSALRKATRQ
jgi:hypothetical protein